MRTHDPSPAFVRPSFTLLGQRWPFYGLFVWIGTLSGIALTVWLSLANGVPFTATATAIVSGLLAAGALALGTPMVAGREVYTFYHYQLVVLAAGGGVLALLGGPALPVLDLMGPALALIQAFGRLGCFMAGCCYGRPQRWGVCYGDVHADVGFARELVGVRLLPIQAFESSCLFLLAAAGAALALWGAPAGSALATYLVGYGAIRFGLEFARGDAVRAYARGFSEAQWTAVTIMTITVAAEIAGLLPRWRWHAAALTAVVIAALAVTIYRRIRPSHALFRAAHVSEFARTLDSVPCAPLLSDQPLRVARTSLGLGVSAGLLHHQRMHYALSTSGGALSESDARHLAALILCLRYPSASSHLLPGGYGVFHVLIEAEP